MKPWLLATAMGVCVLSAQTTNLSGVWKANLEKSKINGPAPSNYLMIIDQQDSTLKETIGVWTPRGEQRSSVTYKIDGKPANATLRGIVMRSQASWSGNALTIDSKIANTKPGKMSETYTLSPDGNTLTIASTTTMNGRETQQQVVLEKQPDSAGEPLRKPEQTAGERFKNLQIMQGAPASSLLDTMRAFTVALGTDCEFCHVQGKFDADDKPEKKMARKMMIMARAINQQAFEGKMEVRCYTCHQGQHHPASHPAFE
jgi:hypothetical protein